MMRNLLIGGTIALTSSFVVRPRRANARAKPSALPNHIIQQLEKRQVDDKARVKLDQLDSLNKWLGPMYEPVISSLENQEHILDELDYIKCIYRRPLSPTRRIDLRRRILSLIEKEKLTSEQQDLMIYILSYFDCI
jgi:hypothetical protein